MDRLNFIKMATDKLNVIPINILTVFPPKKLTKLILGAESAKNSKPVFVVFIVVVCNIQKELLILLFAIQRHRETLLFVQHSKGKNSKLPIRVSLPDVLSLRIPAINRAVPSTLYFILFILS